MVIGRLAGCVLSSEPPGVSSTRMSDSSGSHLAIGSASASLPSSSGSTSSATATSTRTSRCSETTIFRIASMTKPVTVAAALSLMDEGKLALADPIAKWLPELSDMRVLDTPGGSLDKTHPARRPITIDDLMTHRSGLAYFFSVTGPLAKAYSRISARQNPDGWLAEVAALPLEHQPGDRLTYSNATDVFGRPA